jgi:Ni/Co efflux regulator RcnB
MKMKSLVVYAVALGLASPAFADDHRGPGPMDSHHDEMRHDTHHDGPHMAGHDHHDWQRGSRLPPEYRSHNYVVNDWHSRHLRRPPSGYHWVRADNDLVLVGITSGIIADIILNHG